MDDFWGLTILLIILLVAFSAVTVRAMQYYTRYYNTRHKRVRFTDCEPHLKSGDIILYVSHTHGFSNSVFTGDLYSHGGMLVKIGGVLHVTESTVDSLPDPVTGKEIALPEGSFVIPLRQRLHAYAGSAFVMSLKKPLRPEQELRLRELASVYTPYPSVGQLLRAMFRISSTHKARHCMQHIAWLLDEIDLTPSDLLKNNKKFLTRGCYGISKEITSLTGRVVGSYRNNEYGEIYELLYDGDVVRATEAFGKKSAPALTSPPLQPPSGQAVAFRG
jgi:hypothetical protein